MPVANVEGPNTRDIVEAVVAPPAVTTVTLPKPDADPLAAMFTTATLATATLEHAVLHIIMQVPAQAAAALLAK